MDSGSAVEVGVGISVAVGVIVAVEVRVAVLPGVADAVVEGMIGRVANETCVVGSAGVALGLLNMVSGWPAQPEIKTRAADQTRANHCLSTFLRRRENIPAHYTAGARTFTWTSKRVFGKSCGERDHVVLFAGWRPQKHHMCSHTLEIPNEPSKIKAYRAPGV
jgi:hypothetical protein